MFPELVNSATGKLKALTSLEIADSTFSEISSDNSEKSLFCEYAGIFIPRDLKGFVRVTNEPSEDARRTIHEVSHGIYMENFPQGKEISSQDKKVALAETGLFGRILCMNDKIPVVTGVDGAGLVKTDGLSNDTREYLMRRGVNPSEFEYVAFVRKDEFRNYANLRRHLNKLVKGDIETHEGFCVLMETLCSEGSHGKSLGDYYSTMNDVYGRGFRKMKKLIGSYGVLHMVEYLKGGGG
jgi:hypothetical protein